MGDIKSAIKYLKRKVVIVMPTQAQFCLKGKLTG